MILRCSQKFLNFMGISKREVALIPANENEIHDWHAHLFYLNRRKHLIFTHSASLFSVVIFDVLKKDIADFKAFFLKNLSRCLYYEEFSAEEINRITGAVSDITFSLTSDRRVIGSINELIYQYQSGVEWHQPSQEELPEFQRRLNQIPMSLLKMKYPIERFRECVKQLL